MSKERIINLGFGNFVVASRVVGIINPASSPMRRLREDAPQVGLLRLGAAQDKIIIL